MLVIGGVESVDGIITVVDSVLEFNSDTQAWTELAPMPEPRAYAGVCKLGDEIFVFGGLNFAKTVSKTSYCFNTVTGKWKTMAPMPAVMCCHSAVAFCDAIYVCGGQVLAHTHCDACISNRRARFRHYTI
jgi:N-acetylneuraminic acid mutarotase